MVPVTNIPNAPLFSWPFLDVQNLLQWRGLRISVLRIGANSLLRKKYLKADP